MSLIYIEFISRRPGVALEAFHAVAGGGQEGWAGDYDADVAVLNLGRTWRMGPEPEYLTAWYSPSAGLERLDEWERIFKSGDAARFEEPFRLAARIDRSGVYEPLLEPVVGSAGRYYAEFFDVAPGATRDDVRAAYEERAARHSELELNLLCDRIGRSAPTRAGSRSGARPRMRRWTRSHASSTASSARSGSSPRRSTTTSAPRRCERMTPPLAADGRGVIVAIDHPLYSWPCRGLEDREALLRAVVGAGADAVIVTYGTLRDCRDALGRCGADPQARPHDADARGLRHDRVRGGLDGGRRSAPRAPPRCSRSSRSARRSSSRRCSSPGAWPPRRMPPGVAYVCEIMPPGDDPLAIAACCRTARRARRARRQDLVPAAGLGDRRCGRLRHPGRAGRRRPARSRALAGRRRRRDGGPARPASPSVATSGAQPTRRRWCATSAGSCTAQRRPAS